MAALDPYFDPDRWIPPPDRLSRYRVSTFMRAERISTFDELVQRASADPEWFYPAATAFLRLPWMRPWKTVCDESAGPAFGRWFVGATTNLAWAIAEAGDPDDIVLSWEGDDGDHLDLSRRSLDASVRGAAAEFRRLGVSSGDVIMLYAPMIVEAVVTVIAAAAIGAIVCPAFSGYGVDALADRMALAQPSLIVTADGMYRRGRAYELAPTCIEARQRVNPATPVVVVSRMGVGHQDALDVHPWPAASDNAAKAPYEEFGADQPWLLTYTSGSTGRPKGVVHSQGGMPYGAAIELGFAMDLGRNDALCWPSDMGWIVGPIMSVVPLMLGARTVLFEGVADYPDRGRLWNLVERHRLTHVGLSPTTARILAQGGDSWTEAADLESLRIIGSTGEPWTLPAWRWLHRAVGRGRVPIINWAGGTEVGGGILSGSPVVATDAGRFSSATLGMAADAVDDEGRSVIDTIGELVIRRSWPSMTHSLWNDGERYLETYWSRLPNVWWHGDKVIRHSDGSWELLGRSDDVMKIAGKRVGPSDLEAAAELVPEVSLAGAVGLPHPSKGEVAVIAVTLNGVTDHSAVAGRVADSIERSMGKPMRPFAVVVVDELPITRSGKVHRRALKAWLSGAPTGDAASLDNAAAEAPIRNVAQLQLVDLQYSARPNQTSE